MYGLRVNRAIQLFNEVTKVLRVDQIRAFLKDKNLKAVARDMGISYQTVRRVAMGLANPDYDRLVIMSDYIESELKAIQGGA